MHLFTTEGIADPLGQLQSVAAGFILKASSHALDLCIDVTENG